MAHLYNINCNWICSVTILLLTSLLPPQIFAQSSNGDEIIKEMDLSIFKNKSFLNKAVVIDEMLEPFRDKQLQKEKEYTYQEGSLWFSEMFNLVERGDASDRKKPDRITGIINRTRSEIIASNIIPIGIINCDAVILTDDEVKENIQYKKDGKQPADKEYERFEMILPGLFQDEVFQGKVEFQISPGLVYSNLENPIEYLEIDFRDGTKPERFSIEEKSISHHFNHNGKGCISILRRLH